jgi:hypothetical protein
MWKTPDGDRVLEGLERESYIELVLFSIDEVTLLILALSFPCALPYQISLLFATPVNFYAQALLDNEQAATRKKLLTSLIICEKRLRKVKIFKTFSLITI